MGGPTRRISKGTFPVEGGRSLSKHVVIHVTIPSKRMHDNNKSFVVFEITCAKL